MKCSAVYAHLTQTHTSTATRLMHVSAQFAVLKREWKDRTREEKNCLQFLRNFRAVKNVMRNFFGALIILRICVKMTSSARLGGSVV